MNAMPYDAPQEEWEHYEDDVDEPLPGRPRRRLFTRTSAALATVLVGALAFYAGVRVEKSQMSSVQSSTSTRAGAAGTGSRATSGASGAGARTSSGGFAAGLFGGGGQSSATLGTVSSVSGDTLYVTEASGNVIKVQLSSATKVSKSVTVGKSAVRPGDTVVIRGLNSNGSVSATTVTDSGAGGAGLGAFGAGGGGAGGSGRSGGSGGSTGSGAGGSGNASSAVNSLFGSGGGGG